VYAEKIGLTGIERLGVHVLRATAATNALDHQADIAKVQEWLGHANIATTRLYDHRKHRLEDSPTLQFAAGYFYNGSAELRCTRHTRESNSLLSGVRLLRAQ
jgi:Phage integrase family